MPDMPQGPHRAVLEELHRLYRRAGVPSIRTISDVINRNEELEATLSHETVSKALRGEVRPGHTLRSLAWGLAELAGVDHGAAVRRVDELVQRAARDASTLPLDEVLRWLEGLDTAEVYDFVTSQREPVRQEILAALPPEMRASYETVLEETKRSMQELARALTGLPPEQAVEILERQDSGKTVMVLSFMEEEARKRVLDAMGVMKMATLLSRELISLADGNPDYVPDNLDGDLWLFGLGLSLLEPEERKRLEQIIGAERAARAITEALTYVAAHPPQPDPDPDPDHVADADADADTVPASLVAPPGSDRAWNLWDELAEYLSTNLDVLAKDRDLQPWTGADDDGVAGRRLTTPFGQADLVCVDGDGALVIVKLRRGLSTEALFGQVTGLVGYAARHLAGPGQRVEAIVVTDTLDEQLGYLCAALPDVRIMRYGLEFSLTEV
jgi:hypothetical protein